MQFIKLQIGCLLVISYIEVTYIKVTLKGKIPCNKRFDLLMAVAPWAVFFDGLTAWIVNHQDVIPGFVNRLAHLFFFMDLTIIITAEYMYEQLIGIDKNKSSLFAENPRCAFSPSDYGRNRETGVHPGQDYLVFYGLLSVCLLRDNHILLWNDSVSGDNKASFSPKRKSNGNIILYPDCRTDTGCTDPFSGSTSYFRGEKPLADSVTSHYTLAGTKS